MDLVVLIPGPAGREFRARVTFDTNTFSGNPAQPGSVTEETQAQ
jgi:hypothetical protein